MDSLTNNLIYINLLLIVSGATSIYLGAGFLHREKNTRGFFKYSVFLLSLGCGLCNIGYCTMSLSPNLEVAYYFRLIGLIGIDIYLIAEIFVVITCLNFSGTAQYCIMCLAATAALFDIIIYGHPAANIFQRIDNYTTYVKNDPYRHVFHYTYYSILAVCIVIIGIVWIFNVQYKRERRLLRLAWVSNIFLLLSALPDVFRLYHNILITHLFYCIGILLAFTVFYLASNNYTVFNITVNNISRDIFSTLGTGLLVFDTDYHLNLSNEYADKLLGLDKEPHRIRLKEIFNLKKGEPMKMFVRAATGDTIDYRLTSKVTDKMTLVNFSAKLDRHGDPMCYILVATDLTEENRLIEEAQAANKAKSEFISNITHEIRTPINIISGNDELILRECKDPSIIKYADNINVASRNLSSLVNDVLDFAKIESGKLEIMVGDYNLSSLINDCYNMFLSLATEKRQSLNVKCDPNIPSVLEGDEVRLKQIFSNLLSNAVKYTPDGGTIDVEVSYKELNVDSIILVLKVIDNGIGIKEDDQEHLFENFQRFELSRNRTIQGTGLGLSITRNLVMLLHGTINVESTYGQGSTFTVELPQRIIDQSPVGEITSDYARSSAKYQASFTAPQARILAVDDVKMNLDVFVGLLKNTQINIDLALSGQEALSMMDQTKYDIIFLDHMMPEMDGIEVLAKLRSNNHSPNFLTPVIMLTANAMMGADQKYLEIGFNDYLSKPIRPLTLENMVLKHLPAELVIKDVVTEEEADTAVPVEAAVEAGPTSFIKTLDEFLDTASGLTYAADDEDFYKQIITTYVTEDKRPGMEEFLAKKDWPNYQILAHSLKGTSRTIGANELSEAAKGLEFAVKENRLEYITEHHAEVMEQYGELLEKLKKVL